MKRAAIVLITGFEEIEAIVPMDILRRAGVEVDIVGVLATEATGSHNITISTDKELSTVKNELYDIVILPGGMPGAKLLKERNYTCYPGFEEQIQEGHYIGDFVHQDERVITGSGPAAAFEFSYTIVEALGIDAAPLREAMGYNRLLQ